MINLNETTTYTPNLETEGMGAFAVSPREQRIMLTSFLNVAETFLAQRATMGAAGVAMPNTLPRVTVTYSKVTKAKARIAGRDYRGRTGVAYDTHEGRVVKVARNKDGRVYFTLTDDNRDGKFTAIRLEGLRTFAFADADHQRQAVEAASRVTANA